MTIKCCPDCRDGYLQDALGNCHHACHSSHSVGGEVKSVPALGWITTDVPQSVGGDWRDHLLELAENYCDHKKLKGDCLYHIFEPFIAELVEAERKSAINEWIKKNGPIISGFKCDQHTDPILTCLQCSLTPPTDTL